jgi:phenylpropionate dioxygenase-like ring-hydroxylating dioxygenase large terminal subunit
MDTHRDGKSRDIGSAYHRSDPRHIAELTEVGRGTPMGELMRRYWHPVGLASHATATPRDVRVLGEDLILFRDGRGRPGLVWARCCHRGTTLYFGKVEERGIRCCYHGWLFDVEGRCLEQPCEPELGRQRDRIRQPWYPVEERYGLIFAYLGPPEKKPALPRYECLEVLGEGEMVDADDTSIGSGGDAIAPCNWLQHYENVMDPYHVPILHGTFSGTQFAEVMNQMPQVSWDPTDRGVKSLQIRRMETGKTLHRITEVVLPTLRVVPNPFLGSFGRVESIGWTLPIDDTHYRIYTAGRAKQQGAILSRGTATNRKRWRDMSPDERRAFPGDWEAQIGQGAITAHSEEHLATSDKGVAMLRRVLKRQVEAVAEGKDPMGVSFDQNAAPIGFDAGNWVLEE